MNFEIDEFAAHAFEAYANAINGRDSDRLAKWADLSDPIKESWRASARRVVFLCGAALMVESHDDEMAEKIAERFRPATVET